MHSLATRVPKVILTRVDWTFPVLKNQPSDKLDETSTEAAYFGKDVNAEELLGEQSLNCQGYTAKGTSIRVRYVKNHSLIEIIYWDIQV